MESKQDNTDLTYKRIRTREEFIDRYGNSWPNLIEAGWNSLMDCFLGMPLEAFPVSRTAQYGFSSDMFVPISKDEYDKAIAKRLPYMEAYAKITSRTVSTGNICLRVEGSYETSVNIIADPTSNCQLASIAGFNKLFRYVHDGEPLYNNLFIEAFVDYASAEVRKRQFIFDVYEDIYKKGRIQEIFTEVVPGTPYVSTNRSKMVLGILKLKE
jgi:hypothetical protein